MDTDLQCYFSIRKTLVVSGLLFAHSPIDEGNQRFFTSLLGKGGKEDGLTNRIDMQDLDVIEALARFSN
ncbi:hypothetical protein B4113_2872 [Geobacillus sp. B4113_201601]|nr:hypothetical protein B4113_2872 [Geobacillus sp. B4113_201601]